MLTLMRHDKHQSSRALDGFLNVGNGNDIVSELDIRQILLVDVRLVDDVGELFALELASAGLVSHARLLQRPRGAPVLQTGPSGPWCSWPRDGRWPSPWGERGTAGTHQLPDPMMQTDSLGILLENWRVLGVKRYLSEMALGARGKRCMMRDG
jgi:hypothetical protein